MFRKARRTIGEHIKNIYEEGELDKESTWREFCQVQKEGEREVFRFVWFLKQNKHHLNETRERKISDNTLVTLALVVAQSLPEQRETIQKLIMNLIIILIFCVDELSTKVQHAMNLIQYCQQKLKHTEEIIQQAFQEGNR